MKKLTALILMVAALAFASAGVFAKEWKKIRIGVEGAYPPFSYVTPDGKLEGFDIDLAIALCEEMGAECTMVQQDWDGIIPALLEGKYDAICASMTITEQRKEHVAFTKPYENTPAKFARPEGSDIEITKEGLEGKVVGVQRGTVHDDFITAELGDVVKVQRYSTQEEAYRDAEAGRLDLLFADSVALYWGFLKTEDGQDWEFVGRDYTDPTYFGEGAGIAIRKSDEDLVELFNKAIDAILADGTYEKIKAKYFGVE